MKRFSAIPLLVVIVAALGLFLRGGAFAHEGHRMAHNHPYPKKRFSVAEGKVIYQKYCASCHGKNGDGKGPAAAALKPRPTNFLELRYMSMRSRVDLYESIANGRPNTAMSPWKGTLSEKEIWDTIAYIGHLFNHRWQGRTRGRKKSGN
ncbi:MAG: c-type cytochrome [Nitrospinota bacterium]